MSIISLQNVSLHLGSQQLLDHVDWHIQEHDKIALVGRNGSGKSTLLKLLQNELSPDSGHVHQQQGLRVAGLTQDVPVRVDETVYEILVKPLGTLGAVLVKYRHLLQNQHFDELALMHHQLDDLQGWAFLPKIETIATRLSLDLDRTMGTQSGGMKRRVLLAAALLVEPDLLLLDEPTNHLDLQAIEWLESYLQNYTGSLVVVTHDRKFLSQVAEQIVDLDRGKLRRYEGSYEAYVERHEADLLNEQKQDQLFDKRLSEEEVWLRTGVKARRTRNEGRVRALKAMRDAAQARRQQASHVRAVDVDVARSGQMVMDVQHLQYSIDERCLVRDFSSLVMRGDKIGIMGPNGCGKTTLVRLLLKELTPQEGSVRHGTGLDVAYFDQLRRHLDENRSVMDNVADGADFVTVAGKKKHVASYLRDFLFSSERLQQPVSVLSGGERNRLLLARLLAKPVNVLVMDEPTNDLDIETLELLESMLVEYSGTLLVISHDRAFINNVVTRVWIAKTDGRFDEYVGGYDDYLRCQSHEAPPKMPMKTHVIPPQRSKKSFNEQRELSKIPHRIEVLEKELACIQNELAQPDFYQQSSDVQHKINQKFDQKELEMTLLYQRWDELENNAS